MVLTFGRISIRTKLAAAMGMRHRARRRVRRAEPLAAAGGQQRDRGDPLGPAAAARDRRADQAARLRAQAARDAPHPDDELPPPRHDRRRHGGDREGAGRGRDGLSRRRRRPARGRPDRGVQRAVGDLPRLARLGDGQARGRRDLGGAPGIQHQLDGDLRQGRGRARRPALELEAEEPARGRTRARRLQPRVAADDRARSSASRCSRSRPSCGCRAT